MTLHRRPRPRGYLKRAQAGRVEPAGVQRYQTIVIDPPWPYADRINAKNRGAKNHYDLMSLEELAALPLASVSAPNSHLYLWTTNSFLEAAHVLMRQWGWTQKTVRTWVKTQMGMGRYYRNNTEHVLFGVRGKQPALVHNIETAFTAPRGPHSAKPEIFYEQTARLSPGPYLDIFARTARQGWTVLGNEMDGERIDVALRTLATPLHLLTRAEERADHDDRRTEEPSEGMLVRSTAGKGSRPGAAAARPAGRRPGATPA